LDTSDAIDQRGLGIVAGAGRGSCRLVAEMAPGRSFNMTSNVLDLAEQALVALDAKRLVSLYADEFVFVDTSSGEYITDKKQLKKYFDGLFALPAVRFSDVSFFRCAERGAGQWTWSGKSLKTGQHYAIEGASLFVLGEDRIIEERIFYDPRSAME
jgi:hypothetical protein